MTASRSVSTRYSLFRIPSFGSTRAPTMLAQPLSNTPKMVNSANGLVVSATYSAPCRGFFQGTPMRVTGLRKAESEQKMQRGLAQRRHEHVAAFQIFTKGASNCRPRLIG